MGARNNRKDFAKRISWAKAQREPTGMQDHLFPWTPSGGSAGGCVGPRLPLVACPRSNGLPDGPAASLNFGDHSPASLSPGDAVHSCIPAVTQESCSTTPKVCKVLPKKALLCRVYNLSDAQICEGKI